MAASFFSELDKPELPWYHILFIYIGWLIVIIVGNVEEFFDNLLNRKHPIYDIEVKPEYSPLFKEFESFYTRKCYGIISDCFNRPVKGAPGPWIRVQERTTTDRCKTFTYGKDKSCLNMGSYNYLGFGGPTNLTPEVKETVKKYGIGSGSNRLATGTNPYHIALEKGMASFLGKEACMVFGMGYATNSTTLPALVSKGDLVLSDMLNHASTVVGCRSSGAKVKVFKHNDKHDLERIIRESIINGQPRTHRPWGKIVIVVEGIYSMEGETCILPDIVRLKKKYNCYLYVDEAHSVGALGKSGRGVCDHFGVDPADVDILMGTFTKSFASVGGYIASDKNVIDHLKNKSFSHIYEASMPAACTHQSVLALSVLRDESTGEGKKKIHALRDNCNFFRNALIDRGFQVYGSEDSPVIPMMLYHPAKISLFSRECLKRNLAVVVVGFPATPLLMSRVRFCLSAAHSREDLEWAIKEIDEIGDMLMLKYDKGKPKAIEQTSSKFM